MKLCDQIRRELSRCYPRHRGKTVRELSLSLQTDVRRLSELLPEMPDVEFKQKRWRLKDWKKL